MKSKKLESVNWIAKGEEKGLVKLSPDGVKEKAASVSFDVLTDLLKTGVASLVA